MFVFVETYFFVCKPKFRSSKISFSNYGSMGTLRADFQVVALSAPSRSFLLFLLPGYDRVKPKAWTSEDLEKATKSVKRFLSQAMLEVT